eukprot:4777390-Lingulodinium_polyedra.AAC.1
MPFHGTKGLDGGHCCTLYKRGRGCTAEPENGCEKRQGQRGKPTRSGHARDMLGTCEGHARDMLGTC